MAADKTKIKGLTIEIGADTKKLGDALKSVWDKSASLSGELKNVNKLLKLDPTNTELLAQKQKILAEAVSNSAEEVEMLREAEKNAAEQLKRGDIGEETFRSLQRETIKAEQNLRKLEKEAADVAKKINDLGDESNKASEKIKDVDEKSEKAEKGLSKLDVAVGTLAGNLASKLVSAIGNCISGLSSLAQETQEYREDIGKLETAFQSANLSTELATKTYKDFYSVLGEEDRSIEAVNHLAKFVSTEKDMATWTDICTGIWGTFGDSLPIEGLTEAANETAKTGELTGVLTDALNWASAAGETFGVRLKANTKANEEYNKKVTEAKSAEDFFKIALSELSTEQERSAFITETLNELYADAAQKYRDNNAGIIEARKATSEYTDAQAALGAAMEPVQTKLTALKASFVKEFTPQLKKQVIPAVQNFITTLEKNSTIKKFSESLANIAKKVLPVVANALSFVVENLESLINITFSVVAAFAALNAAMKVTSAVTAVTTAVKGLTAGVGLATKAQVLWNAAMSANPIGAVITAIALLVAGIAVLCVSLGEEKTETEKLTEAEKEHYDALSETAKAYDEAKQAAMEKAEAELSSLAQTERLYQELLRLTDANGKVKESDQARVQFIISQLNDALDLEIQMIDGVVAGYEKIPGAIEKAIAAEKARIMLQPYLEAYSAAVQKVSKTEEEYKKYALLTSEAWDELVEKSKKYEEALERYNNAGWSRREREEASDALAQAKKDWEDISELYDKRDRITRTLEADLKKYNDDISKYEKAKTLLLEGKTNEAINILAQYNKGITITAAATEKAVKEQREAAKKEYLELEAVLARMEEKYKDTEASMTAEQKKQADERIKEVKSQIVEAKDKYQELGKNMVEGIAAGIQSKHYALAPPITAFVNEAVRAAKQAAQIKSPSKVFRDEVGKFLALGIADGITGETEELKRRAREQIAEIKNAYNADGQTRMNIVTSYESSALSDYSRIEAKLDTLAEILIGSQKQSIYLDGRVLVGETIDDIDERLGERRALAEGGVF
jgi:phage-related minor tail protein